MPLVLLRCYETSQLRLPKQASFWNHNGDPCEKGKLGLHEMQELDGACQGLLGPCIGQIIL